MITAFSIAAPSLWRSHCGAVIIMMAAASLPRRQMRRRSRWRLRRSGIHEGRCIPLAQDDPAGTWLRHWPITKKWPSAWPPRGGGPPGSWDMWLKALFASSCYFFLYLQKSLCHRTSVVASLQQCLRHCASIIMVVVAKLWLVNIIWQIQHRWLTKSIRTVCAPIGQRVLQQIGRSKREQINP